ncbi:SEFIR domain-containing protein [Chitinophaga rhizophila]|uniref:TIR domain-containing protein n=1 Tax=Chitinophaga rhizophila TaxID=2866212 RepID=A0ABS7G784_9BACT|nr:SEFIR domain-containing protein [Chitinophaga rhizophila]MBW8683513.1 TIR domain-containing protein [Chitinophaga rhizophila]
METKTTRVFISYAHDNKIHEQRALELADLLCSNYLDCNIDQYVENDNPEKGWPHWMSMNLQKSDFVLVIASEKFFERYSDLEKDGSGLGAKWESILTEAMIYNNDGKNMTVIPVFFSRDDKKFIPPFLNLYTHYDLSDKESFGTLLKRMKGELKPKKPKLGQIPNISADSPLAKHLPVAAEEIISESPTLPDIPEFTSNMKPGRKIMQAFYSLTLTRRFAIAKQLGLIEENESINSPDADELCAKFLIRAKEKDLLASLWSILFTDESTDPNPFK